MLSTQEKVVGSSFLAFGQFVAVIVAAMLLAAGTAHASTTFTVTNTDDSGAGSLRQAILDANSTPGSDTINFDIPGTGVHTISPTSALPTITDSVTVDGYSQPGAKPNTLAVGDDAVPRIELSGAGSGSGLRIGAANSTLEGLVINRYFYGIHIEDPAATGNRVTGNFIGTDASGTKDLGNRAYGVLIEGARNNAIGGVTAAERNVISGNGAHGVGIFGPTGTDNQVLGNYVGTDKNGSAPLGNDDSGVGIYSPYNTVGGTQAGARNVISANGYAGVYLTGAQPAYATRTQVAGNYIGTDASGTKDLGNHYCGVFIGSDRYSATYNTIGGTQAGARNIISGNDGDGVRIAGSDARGNQVLGNYVGTDKDGALPLGNSGSGVFVQGYAPNNTIGGTQAGARNVISANDVNGVFISGAMDNQVLGNYVGTDKNGSAPLGNSGAGAAIAYGSNATIGGTQAGARNVISANGDGGVLIFGHGSNSEANRVLSNSIFANDRLGIDLVGGTEDAAGVTANDDKDPDSGPNYLQNFPIITSARTSSANTTIQGALNSTPNKTFTLQFFQNPSGENEGKRFVGEKSVTTDASGNATFTFVPAQKVRAGQQITGTATGAEGTSEFSRTRKVVAS
jgi:hypothetical protein